MLDDVKIPELKALPQETREELRKFLFLQKEALELEIFNIIKLIERGKK